MDIIFIILIFGCFVGAGKAIQEMKKKKREKFELKKRLGNEYDEFINMRKEKHKL